MTVTLYNLGVCGSGVVGGGCGFLDISTAECVVETSIHVKAKSEKHMTAIFYLYDCISFNDLP